MEFTSKYLNSLKTLHYLKTFPHPNTLQGNKCEILIEFGKMLKHDWTSVKNTFYTDRAYSLNPL